MMAKKPNPKWRAEALDPGVGVATEGGSAESGLDASTGVTAGVETAVGGVEVEVGVEVVVGGVEVAVGGVEVAVGGLVEAAGVAAFHG